MQSNKIFDNYINKFMIAVEVAVTIGCIAAAGYLLVKNVIQVDMDEAKAGDGAIMLEVKQLLEPEFELMVRTVYAEAGNQSFEGKRLVAAVILNRVDSDRFPDNITDVLKQEGQFSAVKSGVIYNYDLDDETIKACDIEMHERSNTDVIYFCSTGFVNGTPWKKVGDHYFSAR